MSAPASALPALEQAIRDATGSTFRLTESSPVSGGCIHDALVVGDGRQNYFVKLGPESAADMFVAEADGLDAIRRTATLRVPDEVCRGGDADHAWLVLEHLTLRPVSSAEDGTRFAAALADLHRHVGETFGWHRDNFIGLTPQTNAPSPNWSRFFVEQRLRPQFALARRKGFDGELQRLGERLFDRVPALFLDYRPRPALLHGDLWHGNAAIDASGTPVVFDPAVHHGDPESDLAMTELFGGFPTAFYAEYRRRSPPDPECEARKPLYRLYHVLNHLNLFGRGYLGESERLAKRLVQALCTR
ncbi:fructosamine kinase family protein [Rhodocyclaceae bacterium SMB388]